MQLTRNTEVADCQTDGALTLSDFTGMEQSLNTILQLQEGPEGSDAGHGPLKLLRRETTERRAQNGDADFQRLMKAEAKAKL